MKQELKKEIGVKLKKFRKKLGLTQAEMVANFDIGRANYSRIEKGEVFPNAEILFTLKTKFDISLDWLICSKNLELPDSGTDVEMKSSAKTQNEFDDLYYHITALPMIKHAVLGFFLEYKAKNKKLIRQLLKDLNSNNLKQEAK